MRKIIFYMAIESLVYGVMGRDGWSQLVLRVTGATSPLASARVAVAMVSNKGYTAMAHPCLTIEQMFAHMENGRTARISGESMPSANEAQTIPGWLKLHGWVEKNLELAALRCT